jgi:two-component system, LytTR family, sensor kinase
VWLRINVQSLLVGLIVGTTLNLFFAFLRSNYVFAVERVLAVYLFSYMITACIANTVCLAEILTYKRFKYKWSLPVIYYTALFIGMVIGTELGYVIISLIYKVPFILMDHLGDLKFNLLITCVVGTIIYINQFQKENYEFNIKDKELQLSRLKELKTKAELQSLQSRINPHFLYNALNSIASLIHDKPDKAEDMTIKLSRLFRYSINTKDENFVSIKDEMEIVKIYLDIEKVRFEDKVNFSIDVDDNIRENLIPRFLIQPLIENSLKHGINKISGKGDLSLKIKDLGTMISISVHDNGPPFPTEMNIGYGMQSTYDKLNLLYVDDYELQLNNTYKEIKIILPKK